MASLTIANQTTAVPNMFIVPVHFDPQTSSIAGLQFDFTIPAGTTFQSVTICSAATAASKQISSSAVGAAERVIVFGLNQTLLLAGIVANLNLVAKNPGSPSFHLSNTTATDPNGVAVPLTTVNGVLTINPIGGPVATTLAQLQTDLAAAQTALTAAQSAETSAQTALTSVQTEVNFLLPLANPDVTAEDTIVQALISALGSLQSSLTADATTLNSIAASIKVVTGK